MESPYQDYNYESLYPSAPKVKDFIVKDIVSMKEALGFSESVIQLLELLGYGKVNQNESSSHSERNNNSHNFCFNPYISTEIQPRS